MTNLIKSWNDRAIRIRSDRYVSLTDMAQATGKNVNDFLRLDKTKSYLEVLSAKTLIPVMAQNKGFQALVETRKGGDVEKSGTWGHPKVAIRFAQWCNDEFAVWVDEQIDELMTTGSVSIAAPETKRAIAYYSDRVADLPQRLSCPDGYWAVIEECGHLLLEVERSGYPVNRFDLLDGSVGKHWANHRRSLGMPESTAIARYKLDHKPSAPISITVYPFSEMGIFKQWLKEVYMRTLMPKYLQEKYGKLVKVE